MDLIDLRYVVPLIEAGGVMPRWQDLPKSARITVHNLWRLNTMVLGGGALAVLVLSYPWRASPRKSRTHATSRPKAPLTRPKCPARTHSRPRAPRPARRAAAGAAALFQAGARRAQGAPAPHLRPDDGLRLPAAEALCLGRGEAALQARAPEHQQVRDAGSNAGTFGARVWRPWCAAHALRLLHTAPLGHAGGTSIPGCSRSA